MEDEPVVFGIIRVPDQLLDVVLRRIENAIVVVGLLPVAVRAREEEIAPDVDELRRMALRLEMFNLNVCAQYPFAQIALPVLVRMDRAPHRVVAVAMLREFDGRIRRFADPNHAHDLAA